MARALEVGGEIRTGTDGKEIAHRLLRAEIVRGDLSPGQRLVESELSQRYGTTRNSVRLALEVLILDGLVERIPNRGARVRPVDTAEAIQIMECRMVIDGLLTRKAAECATDSQIDRLLALRQRMVEAVADAELAKYSELIQEHHALIREMSQHQVGAAFEERLDAQIVRHQFQLSLRPKRARQSLAELGDVVEAVAARDPIRAEAAARAHLNGVITALIEESAGNLAQRPSLQ